MQRNAFPTYAEFLTECDLLLCLPSTYLYGPVHVDVTACAIVATYSPRYVLHRCYLDWLCYRFQFLKAQGRMTTIEKIECNYIRCTISVVSQSYLINNA